MPPRCPEPVGRGLPPWRWFDPPALSSIMGAMITIKEKAAMPDSLTGRRRSVLHETRCQTCSLSSLCLPLALEVQDMDQFDAIIRRRAPLKKGETLFRQDSPFTSVYRSEERRVGKECRTRW